MAGTVVKIDGTEVALGDSKGTVVNITLRQESAVAYLCRGAASLIGRKTAAEDATGDRRPGGGQQNVLGGALIVLGAVCIGLGVIFSLVPKPVYTNYYYYDYYYYDYNRAFQNGVPFWMGSLFILSGTSSAVGARHGGKWVHLATFLNLGSVVAGSVAFTLGLTEILPLTDQPGFVEHLCKHRAEHQSYRSWEPTTSPPYDDPRDQDRATVCQEVLWGLVRMWASTQILLLILHSVALAIALVCVGYGLRRLCCSCWGGWKDYMAVVDAEAPLVPEEPGKEQNPA